MNDQLNVGVIGVGAFMGRQHLPNIRRNPSYRIHTLCDLNADLLRQRATEFKPLKCASNSDEVFEDPGIDVIFVGTRSQTHAAFIEKALSKGKHVFVEKPMTMTLAETARILGMAKGSTANVGVGFNRRFSPIMIEARRRFHGYKNGPANIIYRIVDDHDVRPGYIFDLEDGGGHLLQEGCHIFDLLAWFLGEEPVEIYAAGPLETDNLLILKFSGGSLASVICGGKGGLFYPKESMEVFCNRTTLIVDHFFELRQDGPAGNEILTFALDPKSAPLPGNGRDMTALYRSLFDQRPPPEKQDHATQIAAHKILVDKGHDRVIDAFARDILDGRRFSVGAVDGARATICALKGYESIRANRPVPIRPEEYGLA
jgi:predicted dehydrogenase